ncbi:MAG: histidine kinase [Methylocystis sp.]|uniref:sensor histidine kinase n=1 Tax=Methylocystis sp. TaxID=1911079 RepID=UPI003D1032FB
MRLIIGLVLQLVGIALLCFTLTAGWVMFDAHRAVEAEATTSADRVAHQLENLYWHAILWRGSMRRDNILPIPEWQSLTTLKLVSPGVCISYAPGAQEPDTLCSQLEGVGAAAPAWFSNAYERIFGAHAPIVRPLTVRQPETGAIVVRADPDAAIRQAWRQISIIVSVAASMAFCICALAAIAIVHALAPTRAIVDGLRQLEQGNYGSRLNAVTKGEFGLIARAVNDLAERLAQTTAERAALTKRLFEVQEEERRALARDLHDEFGQCLTATLAFAGSIEAAAAKTDPGVTEDARSIARVAKRMMTSLRDALARLRSQDLEELGLETCLLQLAATWNAKAGRKAVVHVRLFGELGDVPQTISTSLYRIAQECLTNAMRHGDSKNVYLRVERGTANDGLVALTVEDDGGGDASRLAAASGHGILGIRERIAAFGGSLSISDAAHGVRVVARIPFAGGGVAAMNGLAPA